MSPTQETGSAEKTASRIIVRIELTPSAKQQLNGIAKRNGATQVAVTSRVLEWFATQDELVQAGILGHYPHAIQGEIAKLILKRMGKASKGKVSTKR